MGKMASGTLGTRIAAFANEVSGLPQITSRHLPAPCTVHSVTRVRTSLRDTMADSESANVRQMSIAELYSRAHSRAHRVPAA